MAQKNSDVQRMEYFLIVNLNKKSKLRKESTKMSGGWRSVVIKLATVGCVFPMVIWSEFRMGQYRHDDHREDAPYFT